MYRKVPSWRAGLCSKVNEGKVTEWMQLKWRLTIFYISPVLLSAARLKKKKKKVVFTYLQQPPLRLQLQLVFHSSQKITITVSCCVSVLATPIAAWEM